MTARLEMAEIKRSNTTAYGDGMWPSNHAPVRLKEHKQAIGKSRTAWQMLLARRKSFSYRT
jgi:hypothetical protein